MQRGIHDVTTTRIGRIPAPRTMPPFHVPLLAGLPIGLCLIVMDLPVLGHRRALLSRALLLLAYLLWTVPVTALQRTLWKRRTPWWASVPAMLTATYAMAVLNNGLMVALSWLQHWPLPAGFRWTWMFRGLESCWLALIAFCAVHAVVAYYTELQHERTRRLEAATLARDAELRALRFQLHPHFLFNTLNAISALVSDGHSHRARQMIARLGDFLRATLDSPSQHEVALAEEIALTETYLDIEKARLGDRLLLDWHIGPDLLRARVPHLLLQPLVENAIRHGIARRRASGRLAIGIDRAGEQLHIRLRNDSDTDGEAPKNATRHNAVGLGNVAERLLRLYPGAHTFHAGPDAAGGYEVSIDLPYRTDTQPEGAAA